MTKAAERHYRRARVVHDYSDASALLGGERAILELVRDDLPRWRMLDVGVGGGRTTLHFAPLVREYLGVDRSAPMIDACRARFASRGWAHVRFAVADARAMPELADGTFDFVVFSFNGLDVVGGPVERAATLREIRRVLRRGGLFAFSSHDLRFAPREFSLRHGVLRGHGRLSLPRLLRRAVRIALLRPFNPWRLSPARDRAMIADGFGGLRPIRCHHILPAAQLRDLERAGFGDPCVVTPAGRRLRSETELATATEPWQHYLCRG